jgi:hypothetical protein
MPRGIWVYDPKPAVLKQREKEELSKKVSDFVASSKRLSEIVNRINIRAGRVYLYQLVEQFMPEDIDVQFIKPLIDGKYIEFPLARITLFNKYGDKCTADWQGSNERWMVIYQGNLEECLKFIEEKDMWFS